MSFWCTITAECPQPPVLCERHVEWPSNTTGWWFAEVLFVGCSYFLFGQLLSDSLPPTGTGVLRACSSVSSLCCTMGAHSRCDSQWKRSASSLVRVLGATICGGVDCAAAAAQVDPPHRNLLGPETPLNWRRYPRRLEQFRSRVTTQFDSSCSL